MQIARNYVIGALLLVLSGCAAFPKNFEKKDDVASVARELTDSWAATPPVTYVKSKTGVSVRKYDELPADLAAKPLSFNLAQGMSATLDDVLFALRAQGFRLVSRLDDKTSGMPWQLRVFEGTLGQLLDEVTSAYNVGFEHRNGSLYLVESNRFVASLPQHEKFMTKVTESLKELGATNVRTDLLAGQVHYTAKPSEAGYINDYLTTLSKNAALVNLQVAVLTLKQSRDINTGFDWSKLGIQRTTGNVIPTLNTTTVPAGTTTTGTATNGAAAGGAVSSAVSSAASQATTGTTGTGTATTPTTMTATALGGLFGFAGGQGLNFKFLSNSFSLTSAINMLSTFGKARTDQNVVLGTVSGLGVKIESGNEIPYVKSVGSATASGGSTTGSSQTDVAKSGLTVDIIPAFDSEDAMVTTSVKVELATLVKMVELQAGNSLGTMSQPEMQRLKFENTGRSVAGETRVIGGITYDQLDDSYSNLPGMEKYAIGSQTRTTSRNAIYIAIRPTVTVFTPYADELNAEVARAQAALDATGKLPVGGVSGEPSVPEPSVTPAPQSKPRAEVSPFAVPREASK